MLSRPQATLEAPHPIHTESGSVAIMDLTEVILSPLGFHGISESGKRRCISRLCDALAYKFPTMLTNLMGVL